MSNSQTEHPITAEVVAAARANPDGWVYKVEGSFGADEYVPPRAVIGAWAVDVNGQLTGEFVPNPQYQPQANNSVEDRE